MDFALIFRLHAVQRMFERRISAEAVRQVLRSGQMIEDYSEEMPDPGGLISGQIGRRPIHVVMAENTPGNERVVITVYEPARPHWQPGFKDRRG